MSIFKKEKDKEEIFETKAIEVSDIIAPSSISLSSDQLKLGKKIAKPFFIFSYPRYLSTGWFSPIINLDDPMDISIFIHPTNTETVLRQLRRRVTEVQVEIMSRQKKGLIRDPALETGYQDLEGLRDSLQTAQEKMFKIGVYLTIYGDEEKSLKEVETTLRSILESRLIYLKPTLYQQKEGFNSCAPYGLDQLQVHTSMNTGPLSSIFPFTSFDLSSSDGILYGINRHNNSLILFDRFSLENANSIVFAKSGSGKSVTSDTPVLIKEKGETKLTNIGPLIEKLIKKHGCTQIDEELEGVINPDLEVYSFNKKLQGEWSKVTVAARKKATKTFYKFTTKAGRQITTTGDHNMLILRNGKVLAIKSDEVKKGEFIPLPKQISQTGNQINLNLLELLKNSEKIYVLNGELLIQKNYGILKKTILDKNLDRYLYKYKDGRRIPIQYFWKILNTLQRKPSQLKNIKITSKNGPTSLDVNFPIESSFSKIAGFIVAEGTISDDFVIITNSNKQVLNEIEKNIFELKIPFHYRYKKKQKTSIVISSRVFVEIIKALGGKGKAKYKKVLPVIFDLKKENISRYLLAYFEGDGGIESQRYISATSKSKQLISEISYLLYYFGIIGRIKKTFKKPTNSNWKNKKAYWRLTISGQDNLRAFANNINFISKEKKEKLSKTIQKNSNTNVDIIPGIDFLFREIYDLFSSQLCGMQDISPLKRRAYDPSPKKLNEIILKIENRIQKLKDMEATYAILNKLPSLASIIDIGTNDKELNRDLWKALGESWRLMKNYKINPHSKNVFKAINIVENNYYELNEVKRLIHTGFREFNLSMKQYSPSLNTALIERDSQRDASYKTIQESAYFVWQGYQNILKNIPQIEEKLDQLKTLAQSGLFWDPIEKIEKIENKKEKYVYDLTVDNEVFLAGYGGMFVHNSYAIKLEILRSLMVGVDVIILDPENEYKHLSDSVDGSFFNISLSSPNHVNPFDLPIPREGEKPQDVLRSNIINLVGLIRIMLKGLTPEEDAVVDRALTETYAAKDITPETDPETWIANIPLMEDLENVLATMEGSDSLLKRIRKFTKGSFSNFFNQPTNISTDKPLIVFGIRDMEDELRPIAMFIIMRYIWSQVRSKLKKRILVVDEAWWLMQSEDGASFLYGMAKRARKYWLGVTTITQDVGDFMKSDYGKPIITNSSMQILLKQSPATIDLLQKTFNLTDEEKNLLLQAEVGEGIFFAGQKHVAIKVVASYTEDQIITTNPEEILKIREAKKIEENK